MYNYEFRNKVRTQHQEHEFITCARCKRRTEVPKNTILCNDCAEDASELQRSYRIGGVYADSPADGGF